MNLKPLNNLDEHDTYNFFALKDATGAKGTPVVIDGSGWNNSYSTPIVSNTTLQGNPNTAPNSNLFYSPRWEIRSRVRPAVSGEVPFGIQLYDVKELNQWGYSLVYDKQRRLEAQALISGEAVPITKKGLLLVGPFPTGGTQPGPGKFAVVKGVGDWGVLAATSGVKPSGAFGEFIGSPDNDGYAPVIINCYV